MRQRNAVSVVVAVALLAVLASAAAAAATGLEDVESGASAPDPAATDAPDAATDLSPGQRLTGVIGAQRAEVEGEIQTRAFGVRVAAASSPRAKAGVVAAEVDDLKDRLDALQNRRSALERARENGSVSDGVYRAQIAELVARVETTERLVNATDDVADELPEDDLEAAGVQQSNIAQHRQRATNLSEGESADLARSVVGDDVGRGMGAPPSVNGPVARGNAGANANASVGNATETGAPGRANGRGDGHPPGIDADANATVGAGVTGDQDGVNVSGNVTTGSLDDGTDTTTTNETATDATETTVPTSETETTVPTNETSTDGILSLVSETETETGTAT